MLTWWIRGRLSSPMIDTALPNPECRARKTQIQCAKAKT